MGVVDDEGTGEQLGGVNLDFSQLPAVRPASSLAAEFWIAVRHLMSRKSEAMISIVATLAVVGVIGSVALVNVVTSVMAGFEEAFREQILGANAHIVVLGVAGEVRDHDRIVELAERTPGVRGAAPFVYTEMVLRSSTKHAGVIVKGIDPARTDRVTGLMDDLTLGLEGALSDAAARERVFRGMSLPTAGPSVPDGIAVQMLDSNTIPAASANPLRDPDVPAPSGNGPGLVPIQGLPELALEAPEALPPEALPGILLGKELASTLSVGPGAELQVIDPFGGAPGPMGLPMPRIKRVRVAGVYESGFYEYDNKWTYMANADLQDFNRMGGAVTGVEVAIDDIYAAPQISQAVDEALGPLYYAKNWQQMNQGLFDALRLERRMSTLILFSSVASAALLIVCVLTMTVLTRGKEIAILRAMGAGRNGILRIFVIEGMLIGVTGAMLGTGLGVLACWVLDLYGFPLDTEVYILKTLPVAIDPANVASIAVGAIITCFLATLYPAISAALIRPVDGLRYE